MIYYIIVWGLLYLLFVVKIHVKTGPKMNVSTYEWVVCVFKLAGKLLFCVSNSMFFFQWAYCTKWSLMCVGKKSLLPQGIKLHNILYLLCHQQKNSCFSTIVSQVARSGLTCPPFSKATNSYSNQYMFMKCGFFRAFYM